MSLRFFAVAVLITGASLVAPSVTSCSPAARTILHAVALTAENLDCIFGDAETDPVKQAKNCNLENTGPELYRAVENLIGSREALHRTGGVWKPLSDAGTHDAGHSAPHPTNSSSDAGSSRDSGSASR